jgi:hypothetical protein
MKKGISLIVLVITIIVIIILAGAVILSLSQNNPISSATEASFKTTAESYNSQLALTLASKYVLDPTFNPKAMFATVWDGNDLNKTGTVKEHISSITAADGANYIIQQGKLIYIGSDVNKKTWSTNLGLSDPYVKSGLILWLDGADFKNSPQTASWIDRSGSGNNATALNFGYTNTSGSNGADAVALDGADDCFSITNPAMYSSSFTISMTDYFTEDNREILFGDFSLPNSININFEKDTSGRLRLYWNASPDIYTPASVVPINQWCHLTVVVDRVTQTVKFYVNSVEVSSYSGVLTNYTPTGIAYIGRDVRTGITAFKGNIKNVQVYNRVLTGAEILQNYNATK